MYYVGIDLAWTYKNETGLCIIDENGTVEHLDSVVYSDEEIIQIIKNYDPNQLCIGIDAPLIVNNENGSRGAEGELMRNRINGFRISVFNVNRRFMNRTYGQLRGETLAKKLITEFPELKINDSMLIHNNSIIETFPTGIVYGLFPEISPAIYKIKRNIPYEESKYQMKRLVTRISETEHLEGKIKGVTHILNRDQLQLSRKSHKHLEDKVDAFLCAYGLYAVCNNYATANVSGNIEDGFIMVPVIKMP